MSRPIPVLVAAGVLTALALLSVALRLELRTSNLDLIDPDLPTVAGFLDFADQFGTPNALVVAFGSEQRALLEQTVREVGEQLGQLEEVRTVVARLDLSPTVLQINGLDEFADSYDQRWIFVFVQPVDPRSDVRANERLVQAVRSTLTQQGVPPVDGPELTLPPQGVVYGLTGIPRYALDDRDVIREDITLASAASAIGVLLVLFLAFRSTRVSLLLLLGLALPVLWTLAIATWIPGHLTLLSAFFASILFGLGIDFSIHLLQAARDGDGDGALELDRGAPLVDAVRRLGPALIGAGATSAAVFLAMTWCGFRGFAELGWIAAVGLLLSLLGALLVTPALLVVVRREGRALPRATGGRPHDGSRITEVIRHPLARGLGAALLLATTLALAADLAGVGLPSRVFDRDYLALQPARSVSVAVERLMVQQSDLSPQAAVFLVENPDAAARLTDRLLDEPLVADVRSAADLVGLVDEHGGELELTESQRRLLIAEDGRHAVYAYPAGDVWRNEDGSSFLKAMRAIDSGVIGMPVLGDFMIERTLEAMRRTLISGALLLTAILWLLLRSAPRALLAAAPTVLTLVSLDAALRLCGLHWNPLDVMALPVILGIALDDGIHLVHSVGGAGGFWVAVRQPSRSIVFTTLTNIAAFAPLALSRHRGLSSFALVLILGVTLALAHTLLLLPGVLHLARRKGWI